MVERHTRRSRKAVEGILSERRKRSLASVTNLHRMTPVERDAASRIGQETRAGRHEGVGEEPPVVAGEALQVGDVVDLPTPV